MRGVGNASTNGGYALEKSEQGARGVAKVSFNAKWALDRLQTLIYRYACKHCRAGEGFIADKNAKELSHKTT